MYVEVFCSALKNGKLPQFVLLLQHWLEPRSELCRVASCAVVACILQGSPLALLSVDFLKSSCIGISFFMPCYSCSGLVVVFLTTNFCQCGEASGSFVQLMLCGALW